MTLNELTKVLIDALPDWGDDVVALKVGDPAGAPVELVAVELRALNLGAVYDHGTDGAVVLIGKAA